MINQPTTFDGTTYKITESPVYGLVVSVTEDSLTLELVTRDGLDLYKNAASNTEGMKRTGTDPWVCERIAYVFFLAGRRIIRGDY